MKRARRWAGGALATLAACATGDEGFSNSFALDLGPKHYDVDIIGDGQYVNLHGDYETSLHATWMLRLWQPGYFSPGFEGGLGLAYGYYEDGEQHMHVFECRGDFGPGFEPVPWMRISCLFFGGFGYHELHLPRAVYLATTVAGVGNLGFSYGANAQLSLKVLPRMRISGQFGFRGLYVSDGVFSEGEVLRSVESSTIGMLAGASIEFTF